MEQQSMGKRIMQLRKEKGYTQEQLAEMMGVSAQAVSKWENDVSCPDISILPMLAEKLGVTTDELLGVKPIEPKVVIVDGQKNNKEGDKSFSVSWDGGKNAKKDGIWFAVLIIVLGLAFLVQRLGFVSFGIWSIVWPAVIIGLGISWMIKRFSVFAVAVAGLGLYFLLFNLGAISLVLTWGIIWPSLLVLLGLTILYEAFIPHKNKWCGVNFSGNKNERSQYREENGFVNYECSFSEENRKVAAEDFLGGDIEISFGKSELDLTAIKRVNQNAKLDVDVSFATFDLIVPKTVRVFLKSDKSFGSIQMNGEPNADATMALNVDGDVSFGTMNIFYR
ncbi:MAG TPA: helix-turn-helix domain-containing protein [Clostridia bacterium]|jgi:transcriptional regulator with XRE-family HTH domain|nr:helix-turn-helix domain-containing protein [Clostridia bacterium]